MIMVKKIEDLNYYELLEVSPTATSQEVHKAYERIRRIYEPNSIALYSLFTPEETAAINQRIEEAYRTLTYESQRKRYDDMLRGIQQESEEGLPMPSTPRHRAVTTPSDFIDRLDGRTRKTEEAPTKPSGETAEPVLQASLQPPPPFNAEFTGPAMRLLREQRGLSVRSIAEMTKVGTRYLELIEEEIYDKLPVRPYLRGFLMAYARALGYEPDRVVGDYLKRYDAAMESMKKK